MRLVDSTPHSGHTSSHVSQLLTKVVEGDVTSLEEFEQLDGDDARIGLEVAQEVTFFSSLQSLKRNILIPSL